MREFPRSLIANHRCRCKRARGILIYNLFARKMPNTVAARRNVIVARSRKWREEKRNLDRADIWSF